MLFLTLLTLLLIKQSLTIVSSGPKQYQLLSGTPQYVQYHHNYSKVHSSHPTVYIVAQEGEAQRYYPVFKQEPHSQTSVKRKKQIKDQIEVYSKCPKLATGQFVFDQSCHQFLNCWKGRGSVQNCPPGTLFNPKTLECDFSAKVECITGPRKNSIEIPRQSRMVQAGCPEGFSGTIPNYNDCSKFFNCQSGRRYEMTCPPGTLFDVSKNTCQHPNQCVCFNQSQNYKEPLKQAQCPPGFSGITKHPYDCGKFLNCANGMTYIQDCAPGTLFNPALGNCDFPYNVQCHQTEFIQGYNTPKPFVSTPSSFERYKPLSSTFRNYYPSSKNPKDYEDVYGGKSSLDKPLSIDDDYGELEAVNVVPEPVFKKKCTRDDFMCDGTSCVSKTARCNGIRDCKNGKDEAFCGSFLGKFTKYENKRLMVQEKERWNNISFSTCATMCMDPHDFQCKGFNYRKIDKTCFLTDLNIGLTGKLASYPPNDYYELKSTSINCSRPDLFKCSNQKCIPKSKICDGINDCEEDESNCDPSSIRYSVRLTGSNSPHEGRIEVTAFNKTGYICDDKFGIRDADVVCKELGFKLGASEIKSASHFSKNIKNNFIYLMDDLDCLGNEKSLSECKFGGWFNHDCSNDEVVGVICKTPQSTCPEGTWRCDTGGECLRLAFLCDGIPDCNDHSDEASYHCEAPTEYRLVNGSKSEGRLEVKHLGLWGTVCDDDFNEDAAKVVCRSLGFRGSGLVSKGAVFGQGKGPIWLDQVFCYGNETSLESCYHWNWGEHNCDHSEDVSISCSNFDYNFNERNSKTLITLPDRCGLRKDNLLSEEAHFRVVKASRAKAGEYPWQASVKIKTRAGAAHWCGAVVIASKWVLTAAHCLTGYAKGAYVITAGDYDIDIDEGTEQTDFIEEYFIHKNFRKEHKMSNDIALILLKKGFRLNQDIQAICLPDEDTVYETGLNCTISGFGSVETGNSAFSHVLRAGWVPIQDEAVCKMPHIYGDSIKEGMICAGYLEGGIDSCDGDSGGPLACLDHGLFTLYGITSWGQHCGYANRPGVYVKVAHYRKWIDEIMNKY